MSSVQDFSSIVTSSFAAEIDDQNMKSSTPTTIYEVPSGMPISVFNDRYSRIVNGKPQLYKQRAEEMVRGNCALDKRLPQAEIEEFIAYAKAGITPLSGRHLQNGDSTQPTKNMEVFTNCSTTAFSFMNFYLLLNGSGVGRDYSTESCRVNWDFLPNIRIVLDGGSEDDGDVEKGAHPDWKTAYTEFQSCFDSLREAKHKYDTESEDVRWIKVRDSREGWTEVIATLETTAYHRNHKDSLFIFDFSGIRPLGSPIKGMQNRQAQGPIPLMRAVSKMLTIRGARMKPWKQALFIDHYLAAVVVMGMVRRSARMATKAWTDRDIFEFIDIKRGGHLWSANDSILVDAEFWEQASNPRPSHGRRVYEAAIGAAYYDETGEPGFINTHLLTANDIGMDTINAETYINDKIDLILHPKTYEMIDKTLNTIKNSKFKYITNPCQPGWATILTQDGLRRLSDVDVGDVIWSGDKWTTIVKKWSTGTKEVYRYRTTSGVFYGTENHRIVQGGVKIQVGDAHSIDISVGPYNREHGIDPNIIIDGLMIGDGSRHIQSAIKTYLDVGSEQQYNDYMDSEISHLIGVPHAAKLDRARIVTTTIQPDELSPLPQRVIPDRFVFGDKLTLRSFLRGLYTANGSCDQYKVKLKTTSRVMVEQVQQMLSALGIVSYYTTNKSKDITWENGVYTSKQSYDININAYNAQAFATLIGFIQPHKTAALNLLLEKSTGSSRQKNSFDIRSIEYVSTEEVYDITVDCDEHTYWTGGILSSNCGEIVIAKYGAYCVIGDVVLAHAKNMEQARRAVYHTAKALIRVNTMRAIYQTEVLRTNRIGVGVTGIFEYAYKIFGLTFHDLISAYDHTFNANDAPENPKIMEFWRHMRELGRVAEDAANDYADELGMMRPHTYLTMKPSGTISKVMNCTEAAHLPPYRFYTRWVICAKGSAEHMDYIKRGYPIKDVSHQYHNCVVVGFPTKHSIVDVMGPDKVVTADEVTIQEQFEWIRLLEQWWFGGDLMNNQVSYTLKYDNKIVSHDDYFKTVLRWQPHVKCCSMMPFTDESAYAYLPEEVITEERYYKLMENIIPITEEAYSDDELSCDGGACPIEPRLR